MKRPIVLGGAAVALVAAGAIALAVVNGGREEKAVPPAPTAPSVTVTGTPAEAAAPFDFASKTPYAEVELKLPQSVKGQPDLHARLFSAGLRDLQAFSEGSQADRSEAGGDMSLGPYQKTITFDSGVETGKLFSLAQTDYEFTGGAHGNASYTAVLWDKAMKRQIAGADLFRKGADLAALDAALCAALNAEKKDRDASAETVTLGARPGALWSCPSAAETAFVLTAGTAPGKAGGLTFLVGPYVVGPYSDGSYWVNVAQSVIRPLVDPAYGEEFAGEPMPLPQAPGR